MSPKPAADSPRDGNETEVLRATVAKLERELQVEAALERVRARAMAMQKSEELPQVALTLLEQMEALGASELDCSINVVNPQTRTFISYSASSIKANQNKELHQFPAFNLDDIGFVKEIHGMVVAGQTSFSLKLTDEYFREMLAIWERNAFPGLKNRHDLESSKSVFFNVAAFDTESTITVTSLRKMTREKMDVLKRMAKTFEMSFRRFRDLQKAEAQAREAQIEAALERVRAKAMAMNNTSDLTATAGVIFSELKALGITPMRSGVSIQNRENRNILLYSASATPKGHQLSLVGSAVLDHHPVLKEIYDRWLQHEDYYPELRGKQLTSYYKAIEGNFKVPREQIEKEQFGFFVPYSQGCLYGWSEAPIVDAERNILKRFASVVDLTFNRYFDLQKAEAQAREARIEAALEKVRSRSLAMHKSEELFEVVKTVFDRLKELDLSIDAAAIFIFKEDHFEYWFAASESEYLTPKHLPNRGTVITDDITRAREAHKNFISLQLSHAEKNKLFRYIFRLTDFDSIPEERKKFLLECKAMAVSVAIEKNSGIQLNNYSGKRFSEQDNEVLKRFGRVFEQAYTRFLDLQKAEAQAREAQIEAALERVRARSMAMHKSDEMLEVGELVYKELSGLGIASMSSGITLMDQDGKIDWYYMVNPNDGNIMKNPMGIPRDETKVMRSLTEGWEQMKPCNVIELDEEETIIHQTYVAENSINFDLSAEELISLTPKKLNLQSFNFKQGFLLLVGAEKLSSDQIDTTIRFTKAFEQAYTRFLDLQKAEAQAREARIESGLERVRAASMAMQQTDELQHVVRVVATELKELGVTLDVGGAAICTYFQDSKDVIHWTASDDPQHPSIPFYTPYFKSVQMDECWESKNRGDIYFEKVFPFEVKNDFFQKAFEVSDYRQLPEDYKKMILESESIGIALAWSENSAIMIPSIHGSLPGKREKEVLIRFARAFEQAYIRFLDLQKVEAQAREAQIEAALERVRAASLAMHQSSELQTVVNTLFEQVKSLQIPLNSASIFILEEGNKDWQQWVATDTTSYSTYFHLPYGNFKVQRDFQQAREQGLDFYTALYNKKKKNSWFEHAFAKTEYRRVPKERQRYMLESDRLIFSVALQKHIALQLAKYEGDPFTEPENQTLARFAKVFEQAYVRFLDLKKAEAQAREAQIEAALERVRARTMAMHRSEQLPETAKILFEQFNELGKIPDRISIGIINEAKEVIELWVTDQSGTEIGHRFDFPFTETSSVQPLYRGWKAKEPFIIIDLQGETLKKWIQFVREEVHMEIDETHIHGRRVHHGAFFSRGFLLITTHQPIEAELMELLKRFAKVFDQTYTRFLDLQKAEAQAREAQIEAALERVRGRTMAMHQSSELGDVAAVLFSQMNELVSDLWTCGFVLCEPEREEDEWWLGMDGGFTRGFFLPNVGDYTHATLYEGWLAGDDFRTVQLEGEALQEHYDWLMDLPVAKQIFDDMEAEGLQRPDWQKLHAAYFSKGYLCIITQHPCEESEIFKRFAQVFDLTYTRFLDLQKAEAQAREAEIQLALERVRAKSLAMKSSDELHEVLSVLFKQFDHLGIEPVNVFLSLFNRDDRTLTYRASGKSGTRVPGKQVIEVDSMDVLKALYDKWLTDNSDTVEVIFYPREVLPQLFGIFSDTFAAMPEEDRMGVEDFPAGGYSMAGYTPFGYLGYDHQRQATEEEKDILSRFCVEFTRVYQRFLDIQKAEAQGREAQIEAALERVRSASMAMHRSDELYQVITLLSEQLDQLGVLMDAAMINEVVEGSKDWYMWLAIPSGSKEIYKRQHQIHVPYLKSAAFDRIYQAQKEGKALFSDQLTLAQKNLVFTHYFKNSNHTDVPKTRQDYILSCPGMSRTTILSEKSFIQFFRYSEQSFSKEENQILARFGTVFEQSYTRFLDIKKAEAQAREAEVQLALERVRAATMAMHKSEELSEVAAVLFRQMNELGVTPERLNIGIVQEQEGIIEYWSTEQGGKQIDRLFKAAIDEPTTISKLYAGWKAAQPIFELHQTGKELTQWLRHLKEVLGMPFDESLRQQRRVQTAANFKHGMLLVSTPDPVSEESKTLLHRFAGVFEQTYTRFLDLQKAEAQAREAQIEAALERVRAKTMAMHQSHELQEVINTVYGQLLELKLDITGGAFIVINSEIDSEIVCWGAGGTADYLEKVHLPYMDMPIYTELVEGIKKGPGFFTESFSQDEKRFFFQELFRIPPYNRATKQWKKEVISRPGGYTRSCVVLPYTSIFIINHHGRPFSEEDNDILKRMGKVFEQTYTRFLDLQKAEAQAREAQIEAALERVRARTMAMHNTDDIADTVTTFFNELLGLNPDASLRCGVGILSQSEHMQLWTASGRNASQTVLHAGILDMSVHPLLKAAKANWASQGPPFTYALKGNDQKRYFQAMDEAPDYPARFDLDALPKVVYHNSFVFRDGILFAFTDTPLANDIRSILERFASVFGQTYTRYLDLQKAEQRAREAIKQASIERVRGEIASMRSTADLSRITPLVWNELTTLGVPFFRCGVFIVDEKEQKIHSYLSNPQGESLAVWHVEFGLIQVFDEMVASWKKQEVFLTEWDRQGFLDFSKTLMDHGLVDNRERYQSGADAPEHLVLHMVPFAQGMLYVGSQVHLDPSHMELVRALASAFSVAYARYEDFNQLEKALTELKATQAQLIQSEKMASLGELTAGIAHEIQNPLNFVNNFSEVSAELLEELMEELQKGDWEEAKALAGDITQNLQKIVHHGKRADGIVKGMLQHSRSSDGKKEPTDLNALADEYLRLAYHGLRAKDKSFNATLESHFDPGIGQVEMVPQEIGRVILNLLTNAFYAVSEKAREGQNGYVPTVAIKTYREDGRVVVSVSDNANGIPEKVLEKIFQPFFTTKPTGEGTGLGLSMSYDIVRAHGGDLEVQTQEGSGTTFFIKFKPGI